MFIKKFFSNVRKCQETFFFKAGENVTEVNFVIILLNAKITFSPSVPP